MSLTQLFRILLARKFTFAFITVAVLAAVLAASLIMPKKYVAESAVVVDPNDTDPINNNNVNPAQLQPAFVATQIDVIASRNVASKVIDSLNLLEDPTLKHAYANTGQRDGSMRDWLTNALLDALTVQSSHSGNVILIRYASADPQLAARIASSFADSYINASIELKVDPARRQSSWFDKQAKDLRDALEASQQKLAEYQKAHGIIGTADSRLDVENERFEQLSNQYTAAQSAVYANNARAQQIDQSSSVDGQTEMADLLKNPLLQNLKAELARADAKMAQVSQRFDHNHPQYLSAAAEQATLQKQLATETENARSTLRREENIARQNADTLKAAMEQQRTRIMSLKSSQDDFSVLQREVTNARTAYDAALQRRGQTRLESQLDHVNIAILNRAAVPTEAASPILLLNMVLACVFAPLLAIALCVMAELFNRRIHSIADLDQRFGPLLATTPARSSRPRHRKPKARNAIVKPFRSEPVV